MLTLIKPNEPKNLDLWVNLNFWGTLNLKLTLVWSQSNGVYPIVTVNFWVHMPMVAYAYACALPSNLHILEFET